MIGQGPPGVGSGILVVVVVVVTGFLVVVLMVVVCVVVCLDVEVGGGLRVVVCVGLHVSVIKGVCMTKVARPVPQGTTVVDVVVLPI